MELNKIIQQQYGGKEFLGRWIYWTEKRDGSCLAVWKKQKKKFLQRFRKVEYIVMVSSRNQETAEKKMRNDFFGTIDHCSVLVFLEDNPNYIVFGELLRVGKDGKPALSPTRIELHKKVEFIVFDIFDGTRFLNYTQVHQHCFHYGMKCVQLYGEGRFTTIKSLFAFRSKMLRKCKRRKEKREGVVLKAFTPDGKPIYAKEKLDTATPRHSTKIERGQVNYPPLPDSEAQGAVDKAFADLGEKFSEKDIAMPLVAQYINEEMRKHKCSAPVKNFFHYYTSYAEDKGIILRLKKREIPQAQQKRKRVSWWKKLWKKFRL
jgi:hypothetical protein